MAAPLERYVQLLLEWNRRVRLTGARTAADLDPHLADAYELLAEPWGNVQTVIDIGSGGGLPAVPLALRLPEVRFTLLEVNIRKVAFLQHVAGALGLANVRVTAGRAEVLGHDPGMREQFDRAISRAAARPPVLLEFALPFVRVGGDLVAEVAEVDPAGLVGVAAHLGGGTPQLDVRRPGRAFLIVPKRAPTPAAYPRRPGVPNRRPLAGDT